MEMKWVGSPWLSAIVLFLSIPAGATESTLAFDTKDVSVSVIALGEGKQTYPLPKEYEDKQLCRDDGFSEDICNKKESSCEENISYLRFEPLPNVSKDKIAGLAAINASLKAIAISKRCSVRSMMVKLTPEEVYVRLPLVSVVLRQLDYCVSCGGSCHGNHMTLTFDAHTGKEVTLPDIFPALLEEDRNKGMESQLVSPWNKLLPPGEVKSELSQDQRTRAKAELMESLDKKFWSGSFFIRHGDVYGITNAFLFGCSNGNFYPIELNDKYIKPEFLDLLKKPR